MLDAGCGTGNYLAGLHGRVGSLHGVEFNAGMAQVARDRFADDSKVDIQQGSATELSGADGLYDAVVCNQVLHHLDDGDDADFPNVATFFREAYRVDCHLRDLPDDPPRVGISVDDAMSYTAVMPQSTRIVAETAQEVAIGREAESEK